MRFVGCAATSHEIAALGGDDVAVRAAGDLIDPTVPGQAQQFLAGLGVSAGQLRALGGPAGVARLKAEGARADCEVGAGLAGRLRLPEEVGRANLDAFERYDGVALSGRVLAFEWAGGGVLWRAERQTVVRIEQPARSGRAEAVLGQRRHPGDPDGRAAVVPAAPPHDSGPVRLNLPVSCPVLPVGHDDAGWCVGSSTFEHAPASLALT